MSAGIAVNVLKKKLRAAEQEAAGLRDSILLLTGQLEEANRQAEHAEGLAREAEARVRGLECDNERLREDLQDMKDHEYRGG